MSRPGLLLDVMATQSATSQHRGVSRWVTGLAGALVERPDNRLRRLLLAPSLPHPINLPAAVAGSDRLVANTATELRRALLEGPAMYCVGSPFEFGIPAASLLPAHVMEADDIPLAVILYDVIPLLREGTYLDDPGMARRYRQRLELVRRADLVLAISDCTRRDGIAAAGLEAARVVNVGSGVDGFFGPSRDRADPMARVRHALPAIDRPFVLTVSAADERKNTQTLIAAFAKLDARARRTHRLVVTCRLVDGLGERLRSAAAASGLAPGEMILTDLVDDHLLRDLYRACAVFAFPSRYEGFGLPVAEAMACGAPVLTASASSLPEVLDWAEATFEPDDTAGLCRLLARALDEPVFAAELRRVGLERAAEHTWPRVAERVVAAMDDLHTARRGARPAGGAIAGGRGASARVGRRLRVALVGPVPPMPSGIATYNERVAVELSRRCHLDVLAPAGVNHCLGDRLPGVGRFPIAALGAALDPDAYDAIIYTVGNNHDHLATVPAMRRHPGLAWFHEVRLPFLAAALRDQPAARPEAPWAWVEPLLRSRERRPPPATPEPPPWRGPADPGRLAAELATAGRGVLVNSHAAARLLLGDAGPGAASLPEMHILSGLAVPLREAAGTRDQPPLVVSMGIVDPVKAPELLIDAHVAVHAATGADLALVGLVGDDHAAALRQRAAALGIGAAVTLSGRVGAAEYDGWLRRASVAVQLRRHSNGESSAAIGDCLGAGLPLITDHPGAVEELGPEAAVPIAPGAGAADLAAAVIHLLVDDAAWQRQSAASLAYARAHPFSRIAEELLAVVEQLLPTGELRP